MVGGDLKLKFGLRETTAHRGEAKESEGWDRLRWVELSPLDLGMNGEGAGLLVNLANG
jgi:hypothetical protein